MIKEHILNIFFIIFSAALAMHAQQVVAADNIVIRGGGATFPAPLYKHWMAQYKLNHPNIDISYEVIGSGDGIKRFMGNKLDFGASDAAMSDGQLAQVERGVQLLPVTAGIIVLAYNIPGLKGNLKLPQDVYVDIFLGKIRKWNDPRIKAANATLNLPALDIVPVVRLDSSGTTYAFTNHLSAISNKWRDRGPGVGKVLDWPGSAMVARGNGGVAAKIKIGEGTIGYVEYGYAQRAHLQMAWLQNQAGNMILPDPDSGYMTLMHTQNEMPKNLRMFFPNPKGKDSYPIVTYSWIMLYKNYQSKEKLAAIKDFIKWTLSTGQGSSEALGYIRIPPNVSALSTRMVEQIQ